MLVLFPPLLSFSVPMCAGRFRVRHCLSQPGPETTLEPGKAKQGARATRGRVDYEVLNEEFGGKWSDGSAVEHFFMIGTSAMERQVS